MPAGTAVAVVGGEGGRVVTRADLARRLDATRRALTAQGTSFPRKGTTAYRALRSSALKLLVDEARLEVRAERAGVAVTEAQVDDEVARIVRTTFGGSEVRYRAGLRAAHLTAAEARHAIRVLLLGQALRGASVSEPEVTYAPGFAPPNGR